MTTFNYTYRVVCSMSCMMRYLHFYFSYQCAVRKRRGEGVSWQLKPPLVTIEISMLFFIVSARMRGNIYHWQRRLPFYFIFRIFSWMFRSYIKKKTPKTFDFFFLFVCLFVILNVIVSSGFIYALIWHCIYQYMFMCV